MNSIYLDHAATTPVHPKVGAVYVEMLETTFGNPSSIHGYGREARKHLDGARKVLAASIHAQPTEIIFTSGGTEADNIAVFGTAAAMKEEGNHIITTTIEHPAVLESCKRLEEQGYDITYLEVNEQGQIDVWQVQEALSDKTILVSIMFGNNEVGTIQPIREIGKVLQNHQAIFHTDAVQAYGIVPLHVDELGVDLLSVSAHKLNGPKGIGFLYQRKGLKTAPLLFGGGQERKRRAGTENLPAVAAFAEAVSIAQASMEDNRKKYGNYAKILKSTLDGKEVAYEENAAEVDRLPHILNISFPGTDIESLLVNLDMGGIAVSSGSACSAGSLDPSHVLTAMFGQGSPKLRNSVRFSFGLGLDEEAMREAAVTIATIVNRLVK
ncbi:cysteine desulfurase family protein [Bacillus sp. OxB-1]|uniref:cysteine desulfurase family protein n=1 Tax=Bacillus sp. (strain OxB-1) TaxID=98228 RepID=UPI000597DA64|nr:cysteine desulfurase family protein [Bacillus sp. OxB-1]